MLNLCIYNKDIAIPKAESSNVGVDQNLRGRMGISNAWLSDDWLYGATIEACKTIKGIGSVWEKEIVHLNLLE